MKSWLVGYLLGLLLLIDSLLTEQPLAAINFVVSGFLFFVIIANFYGKR